MPVHERQGVDEIQQQAISRLYGRLVGLRAAGIPVVVLVVGLVIVFDPTPWRRWAAVVFGTLLSAVFVIELVRYRRRGVGPATIPLNLGVAVVGQAIASALTGALESPFLYVSVLISFLLGLLTPPRPRRLLVGAQVAVVWALATLELTALVDDLNLVVFGGGHRAGHNDVLLLTTAVVLSVVIVASSRLGHTVGKAFDDMVRRAAVAQSESLKAHAERAAELGALSAEIAHELKNPLASVKGLSGLLVQNVSEGKGAERLAVLRREVERMQGILDEFLNFSRPLVPLSLSEVELRPLLWEVAALHEGVAEERGIGLTVDAADVAVRCDARKVKQVVINLLQNALEASGGDGVVELRLDEAGEGEAVIRVLDRGRGLPPDLGPRVFEAGVTSKVRGSGLGLTIARAIARQHGGELALTARPGGGCVAELRLPARLSGKTRAPPTAAP